MSNEPFPSSPYATSNDPPLDIEKPALDEIRQQVRSRLAPLQEEYARLAAEVDKLQAIATSYDGILSPLRSIPYDILHKIIRHAIVDGLGPYDCLVSDANRFEGPWAYSQVSQRWRAVTLSDPSLWSNIEITRLVDWGAGRSEMDRQTRGSDRSDTLAQHVELLLDRGGSYPLTISMAANNHNWYTASTVMELFVGHRARWHSLNLCLPFHLFQRSGLSTIMAASGARALHFFHLSSFGPGEGEEGESWEASKLIPPPPSMPGPDFMRYVRLDGLRLNDHTSLPKTLTTLCLTGVVYSVQIALKIVRNFIHLQTLRIMMESTASVAPSVVESEQPIVLPDLRKLVLEVGSGVHLLNHITTPSLRILRGITLMDEPIPFIVQFLERSKCQLEELELRCPHESPYGACLEEMQLFCKSCPAVTRLILEDIDRWDDDAIVGLLLEEDDEGEYSFPKLTSFKIYHSGLQGSAGDALEIVISNRGTALQNIIAIGADSQTLPSSIIEACKNHGVEVEEILTESGRLDTFEDYRYLRENRRVNLPSRCQES